MFQHDEGRFRFPGHDVEVTLTGAPPSWFHLEKKHLLFGRLILQLYNDRISRVFWFLRAVSLVRGSLGKVVSEGCILEHTKFSGNGANLYIT